MALHEGVAIGLHLELCGGYYMAAFKRLKVLYHTLGYCSVFY